VRRSTSPRTAVEIALNARREAIRKAALEARLAEEALDVTLPGRAKRAVACIR
jgi:phenylalanyl-tRNA synthetase alpha chain